LSDLNACTIVSKNYIPFARVLARSFLEHHPGARFFVLLVDRVDEAFDPSVEPFELLEVEQLDGIPDLEIFLFKYTILELNTAVKPYFLEHLFKSHGLEKLLYLDPDILVTRPLEGISAELDDHPIVLTPHLDAPIEDDRFPTEQSIMGSGVYNLGFLGIADSPVVRRFLTWWQERVFDRCVVRVEEGLFVDQKWIDLVPGMFDGVAILRDPHLNVAYWNLHCREVDTSGTEVTVNGEPLSFFHFSGVDPDSLDPVSKHQDRFTLRRRPELRPLFKRYRDLLLADGYRETRSWPYAFSSFDDGVRIPDAARSLLLALGDEARRFGNPFVTESSCCFRDWLNEPVGPRPRDLSRLFQHLHDRSLELRMFFHDPRGTDLLRYAEWLELNARDRFKLDDIFMAPLGILLRREPVTKPPLGRRFRLRIRRWQDRLNAWPFFDAFKEALKRLVGPRLWQAIKGKKDAALADRPPRPRRKTAAPDLPDDVLPGINVTGYIRTESGIGEGIRTLIRAVESADVDLCLQDVRLGVASRMQDGSFAEFSDDTPFGVNVFAVNADQVEVIVDHLGIDMFRDRYNIGCWSWELDSFPDTFREAFGYFNEIWTPSRFCVEAISSVAPIPVRRMPHSISVEPNPAADRSMFDLPADHFVFLFVFDFLSSAERKNPLAVVRAFKKAFGDDENALLVLKTSNSDRFPDDAAALRRQLDGAPIRLIDEYISRREVYDLMQLSDCYVSLHRCEGFGLTMAEAMALGKPVIATDYSGNTDFMDVGNSLPVRYRVATLDRDHGPYAKGSRWAEPDIEHAAEMMQRVRREPQLAQRIGHQAQQDIVDRLSPDAVGTLVRERMERISSQYPHLRGLGRIGPTGS